MEVVDVLPVLIQCLLFECKMPECADVVSSRGLAPPEEPARRTSESSPANSQRKAEKSPGGLCTGAFPFPRRPFGREALEELL